jgi:hypothetical protein
MEVKVAAACEEVNQISKHHYVNKTQNPLKKEISTASVSHSVSSAVVANLANVYKNKNRKKKKKVRCMYTNERRASALHEEKTR